MRNKSKSILKHEVLNCDLKKDYVHARISKIDDWDIWHSFHLARENAQRNIFLLQCSESCFDEDEDCSLSHQQLVRFLDEGPVDTIVDLKILRKEQECGFINRQRRSSSSYVSSPPNEARDKAKIPTLICGVFEEWQDMLRLSNLFSSHLLPWLH